MNLTEYLLADKNPAKVALLFSERQVTYRELSQYVQSTCALLAAKGICAGDRIVVLSENNLFWVVTYLAIVRYGAIAVPLPSTISKEELAYVLQSTAPAHIFISNLQLKRRSNQLDGLSITNSSQSESSVSAADRPPRSAADVGNNDLAALMFTSGSTGKPRGVMVSHRNIMANTDSIIASLGLASDDRVMCVLPFHYCFGTSLLHTHLKVGGSIVVDNRFMYPEAVLKQMAETSCTGFAGVPSHFQILLRKSNIRKMNFPQLRYVQQAGGHLAPPFVAELREALPEKKIFVMYGQTEATARLTIMPAELLEKKPGSIGKPISGVKLQLLLQNGNPAARDETGEIVAEGANIALGYWNEPEESAATFRSGRLHTGDIARVDEDGFYYIVDRAKDFLKCGGKRVSCRQLEDVLVEHEGVLEAAVIGVPDELLGEAVQAFVVPVNRNSESLGRELALHCHVRLPMPFQPREIAIVESLPKNSSGKVLKTLLRSNSNLTAGTATYRCGRTAPSDIGHLS